MRTLTVLCLLVLTVPSSRAQEEGQTIDIAHAVVQKLPADPLRSPAPHLFLEPESESRLSKIALEVTRTANIDVASAALSRSLGHSLGAPSTDFSLAEAVWARKSKRKPEIGDLVMPACASGLEVRHYDFCPPVDDSGFSGEPPISIDRFKISQRCADGDLSGRDCKFHWRSALRQQAPDLAIETAWNLSHNHWVRYETFHGRFFHKYFGSLKRFRFSRWSDDDPFLDDYVGHPMMGAISMDIFIQNDPRGMSLELQNTKEYWHSRLWALLWSAVYSAEWKLGPISEASIGNTGYYDVLAPNGHKLTNGTGTVDLVITPIGGWVWNIAEDIFDEQIIRRIETKSSNRLYLFAIQFLNPCRGFANLMRFKAPWYRDSRPVWPRTSIASGISNP